MIKPRIDWELIKFTINSSGGFLAIEGLNVGIEDLKTCLKHSYIGFNNALDALGGVQTLSSLETLMLTLKALENARGTRCASDLSLGVKSPWRLNDDDGMYLKAWAIRMEFFGEIFTICGSTADLTVVYAIQALTAYLIFRENDFTCFLESFSNSKNNLDGWVVMNV